MKDLKLSFLLHSVLAALLKLKYFWLPFLCLGYNFLVLEDCFFSFKRLISSLFFFLNIHSISIYAIKECT